MSIITQYIKERAKWIKFGKPLRSPDKIKELFNICKSCPHFQKKSDIKGKCGVCGCGLKEEGNIFNKLSWSTTRCPIPDNPKWIEEQPRYARPIELNDKDISKAQHEYSKEQQSLEQPPEPSPEPPPPNTGGCGCGG